MSTTTGSADERRVLSEDESRAVRRGVPNPQVPMPAVAWPTLGLFLGSLAAWAAATWVVLADVSPWWLFLTIPVHTAVSFTMFTVVHETVHLAGGRLRWVNEVMGRIAMVFFAAWASFPVLRFIHIEHHRNTNEDRFTDPDAWSEGGPTWLLPTRWFTQDLYYLCFYVPKRRLRPRGEVAEQVGVVAVFVSRSTGDPTLSRKLRAQRSRPTWSNGVRHSLQAVRNQ